MLHRCLAFSHNSLLHAAKAVPSLDITRSLLTSQGHVQKSVRRSHHRVGRNQNRRLSGNANGRRSTCIECGSTRTHWDSIESYFYCENCKKWIFAGDPESSKQHTISNVIRIEDAKKPDSARHVDWYVPNEEKPVKTKTGSGGRDGSRASGEKTGPKTSITGQRLKPSQIFEGLEEYVIGQTDVKRVLSVSMVNHIKRISLNAARASAEYSNTTSSASYPDIDELESIPNASPPSIPYLNVSEAREIENVQLDKTNVMIVGPTGSGKTLAAKVLAKLMDVPFIIFDATCLTEAGYVGEDVESILHKLYLEAGNDVERAQKGIVYVDEIDKIRRRREVSTSRDVSGEGVQQGLLKMLEGTVVNVPKDGSRRAAQREYVQIDTSDILFICGGAFSGLEKIVNARKARSSIGFGANMKVNLKDQDVLSAQFKEVESHDLVTYGLIPEFVGRFATIVSTSALTLDEMVRIITEPKNSLLSQYKVRFALDDTDLHFTDCALRAVASDALAKGTGARGLNAILEKILMDASYEVPDMDDINAVYVDEEVVRGAKAKYLRGEVTLDTFLQSKKQSAAEETDGKQGFEDEADVMVSL